MTGSHPVMKGERRSDELLVTSYCTPPTEPSSRLALRIMLEIGVTGSPAHLVLFPTIISSARYVLTYSRLRL